MTRHSEIAAEENLSALASPPPMPAHALSLVILLI